MPADHTASPSTSPPLMHGRATRELPAGLRGIPARARKRAFDIAEQARSLPEDLDPAGFARSLLRATRSIAKEPSRGVQPTKTFARNAWETSVTAALRLSGTDAHGPLSPSRSDFRFRDRGYEENAYFQWTLQTYLTIGRYLLDLVHAADLSERDLAKARFALRLVLDSVSPANFLFSHPQAMRLAYDSRGRSVLSGAKNLANDVRHNGGWPTKVDASHFEVGKNLATTAGQVVFRNALMEVIQYAPQTPKVHARPIVCSPAWINKYYIMDLAPGKSFVEWAVQHGHTVFMISYRNPCKEMKDVSFGDYLLQGPVEAIRVAREITGSADVNMVGVCMGGTLTMALLGYLAARGDTSVHAATLLNSHTDFSDPGLLGVFMDEHTVRVIDRKTSKHGYLPSNKLTSTFDRLRARDLVWRYVTSGWLMGETPPPFDLLAWNGDATNLPARMQSEYLQHCYVDNDLAQDRLVLGGERLRTSAITQDLYVLAAEGDHIVPWTSSYRTGGIIAGKSRFVLSSQGHIAGIVNPPNPKASYRALEGDERPERAEDWLASAKVVRDTWWNDWATWSDAHGGPMVDPPSMGSETHRPIESAPGSYVRSSQTIKQTAK